MRRVPVITVPPMKYPDITMTNKYANTVDEREKKIGVPKSLVGIGEGVIFFFHCTSSLRFPSLPLELSFP
jgi:hypothetical protein